MSNSSILVTFGLSLIMSLLCKNIGECMRVKITKRAQADEVSILLTGRKILCFNV
jgi:hypothetical protein